METTIKKVLATTIAVMLVLVWCSIAVANGNREEFPWELSTYKVKTGDTLSHIAAHYGVTVNEIKNINKLNSDKIIVGQKLLIPEVVCYVVKPGDTISHIGKNFGVSAKQICSLNNLKDDKILVGQTLKVKVNNKWKARLQALPVNQGDGISAPVIANKSKFKVTPEDVHLLAKLIHAEARGEDYLGKLAVGAVILNRVKHHEFPDNVEEVIFQRTRNGYQFSPVQDGSIKLSPDRQAWKAAEEALSGMDPTDGAIYFYNPKIATDKWIKTLPVKLRIGNHVFAE